MEDFFIYLEELRREALSEKNSSSFLTKVADLYYKLLQARAKLPNSIITETDLILSQISKDLPAEQLYHSLWLFNARAHYACFIEKDQTQALCWAQDGLRWSSALWEHSFDKYDLEKKSYPLITALVVARIEGYRKQTDLAERQMQNLLDFCLRPTKTDLIHFPESVRMLFSQHRTYWEQLLQAPRTSYFTNKIQQSLNKLIFYRDLSTPTDLLDALYKKVASKQGQTALSDHDSGESLSWQQWISSAHCLAESLENFSLASDYVLICSRQGCFLPVSVVACWMKKKVPILLNEDITDLEFSRIKKILREENPSILIDNGLPAKTKEKLASFSQNVTSSDTPESLPVLPPLCVVSPESLALGLFTSGTSELPKLILFSHGNLFAAAQIEAENEMAWESATIANLRPAFTSGGLNTLWPGILLGSCQVFSEKLRKRPIFRFLRDFISQEKPQLLVLSPAYLQTLLESDDKESLSVTPVTTYFGGTSLPIQTVHLFRQRGLNLFMRYGMTEVGHIIARTSADLKDLPENSVGVPFNNFKIKSEEGFLKICSPGAASFQMKDGQLISLKQSSWFTTEDHGEIGEDRQILLQGREHALLCVDGFRFHSRQVESALVSSGLVTECRTVGVSDPKHNQKLIAFCISHETDLKGLETKLRHFAQAHLSPPLRPTGYQFLTQFPFLPNGKIDFKELKSRAERKNK